MMLFWCRFDVLILLEFWYSPCKICVEVDNIIYYNTAVFKLCSRCLVGKFEGPNKGLQIPNTILSIFFVDFLHEILFKERVLWLKSQKIIDLVSLLLVNVMKIEIWYNKKILHWVFFFFPQHNFPVLEIKSSDCYPVLFQLHQCCTVIKYLISLSSSWTAYSDTVWKSWNCWMGPFKIFGFYRQHYA